MFDKLSEKSIINLLPRGCCGLIVFPDILSKKLRQNFKNYLIKIN